MIEILKMKADEFCLEGRIEGESHDRGRTIRETLKWIEVGEKWH
jgi:hypothetical protein